MVSGTPYYDQVINMKTNQKKAPAQKGKRTSISNVVQAPAARLTIEHASPGKMTNPRDGCVRIRRREFVSTVSNGNVTTFTFDPNSSNSPGWDFNPGVGAMFPWLSAIANSYERFRFHDLQFEFVSSQATSTNGRIYAAIDYDWDDDVPTSKAQLMGNMTASEAPVWTNLKLKADAKALMRDMPWKYVNTAGRVVYSEPRTAYSGFLIVAFDTPTVNCRWDLWVTYDIELETPVVENSGVYIADPGTGTTQPYFADLSTFYNVFTGVTNRLMTPLWTSNRNIGSLVREVIGGTADVPNFALPGGWTIGGNNRLVNQALDLARLGSKHYLSLKGYAAMTGITPASLVGPSGFLRMGAVAYDSAGTILGDLTQTNGQPKVGIDALDTGASCEPLTSGTAGLPARCTFTPSMDSVRKLYPTIRYLIPFMAILISGGLDPVAGSVGIDYRIY